MAGSSCSEGRLVSWVATWAKHPLRNNTLIDTLAEDILGILVEYPVEVNDNEIRHPIPGGNSAISFWDGSGSLTITGNETDGLYSFGNIYLSNQVGGSVVSGNQVNGASLEVGEVGVGAIVVGFSDDVQIKENDLKHNLFIPGWSVPGLETSGAYLLVESTNVQIQDEKLPASSQQTCQVLHIPVIDPSNQIDPDLIECVAADL